MSQESKPFYKKWWFILIVVVFVMGGIGSIFESDEEVQNEQNQKNEEVEEVVAEQEVEEVEPEMNIEIEVTETSITDNEVTVSGTTNLIDGVLLSYQINATEGVSKVENGSWEASESIETLEIDNEMGFYGVESEYEFFITFPPAGVDDEDKEILEVYGGTGGTKITGGPNFYESEDGTLKTVSVRAEFDKDGIIDEEEKETRDFENAVKEWDESVKDQMLEHYGEFGITGIEMNPGSDWDVVNVYVPNEFKLSTEEEKTYYVEELGPLLEADLTDHFKKEHTVHVYFKYEDGNDMATRKMLGGWKVK